MVSIYNNLKNFFTKSECERLISYQKPRYKFLIFTDVQHVISVDINELSKHIQEITLISNYIKILDNYQFLMCKEIEKHVNDIEYVKYLGLFRIQICGYITQFGIIAEQLETDINNEQLVQQLITLSQKMTEAISKLESGFLLKKIKYG